ncbi:MAG: ABC transporter permease [Lachnospiraceae bacterium]|nr:ABC transporter permease [Lachnospiraceae bacterium]
MAKSKMPEKSRQRSLFREAMIRFLHNPTGMAGFIIISVMVILSLSAGIIAPEGYDVQDISLEFIRPCREYICGTDNLGRSVFVRLLYGGRVSLLIGVTSTAFATVFGTAIGAVSGFYGGKTDNLLMRFMDILSSVPSILLAIAISAVMGGGMTTAIVAIGISSVPSFARMMRGPILSAKSMQYVEAARSTDARDIRIIFKYILPNVSSQLIVEITMIMANSILTAASLSFLGLGVTAPTPEWGSMISNGRQYITRYPYLVTYPGLCIAALVLALNLVGDGLRDALDPRLKV